MLKEERFGGVVGVSQGVLSANNCYNLGTITGHNGYVGGIIGGTSKEVEVSRCTNNGNIYGNGESCGGVIGGLGSDSTISQCSNFGEIIIDNGNQIGGIVGCVLHSDNVTNSKLEYCYNLGNVTGKLCVGGIVGRLGGTSGLGTATNCYSKGKISGTESIGAIIGIQSNTTGLNTLNNLFYLNTVGIGAIGEKGTLNTSDDAENNIESITNDFTSFEEFQVWIESNN